MKRNVLSLLATLCAFMASSCSVHSHVAVADMGRSADGILVPLENPTICCVNEQWYMCGHKANIERNNVPWTDISHLPIEKRHPERYTLGSDEFTPIYSPIPKSLAESLQKGKYTHSDAISFINRKWVEELPEGEVSKKDLTVSAPEYFSKMSSHRLMQTEQGNFLLAQIGELTADFNAVLVYPLAGLTAVLFDTPASIFYTAPARQVQEAQPEEVE